MSTTTTPATGFTPGALVRARGREWVVQPGGDAEFLVLRPLGGDNADTTGLFPALEPVEPASFAPPTPEDMGDDLSLRMLRDALRIGFTSTAGPFRSLSAIPVQPRSYQLVPLLMALRQDTTRLLIADDVGIGKTIEAGLVAAELLALGEARGLAVLCSPALAEQWQSELREKFAIDAELVLPSTVSRLQRGLAMGESLFDRYRYTVISTDFIKSRMRRDEFLRAAPDLVIVDEAHTSVSDAGDARRTSSRTQRHELLRQLAADPERHLILVTATPHSGSEQGFRNLIELLDPTLADIDLETTAERSRLAEYFVQRRRGDIRHYIDQDTPFPSDRHTREVEYHLTPEYKDLFDDVLEYAHRRVSSAGESAAGQRVAWWSVLALLRALASSPAAARATLLTRAANAGATTVDEADALGRSTVLDLADDEALESADAAPGAITSEDDDDDSSGPSQASEQRTLRGFARRAEELFGPAHDAKLVQLTEVVQELLADGYDPIVFCRFIDTAEYVGEHLTNVLGRNATVATVTGALPPEERAGRIAELAATGGRHVLVATDCLSEGVNLQESFQAIVHYDLAWNPTRHEQREGRVDRFGQTHDTVRAVTLYGVDNRIDGVVLDVLLRKHERIRKATGVSVPVPASSNSVVEALMEGLLLRGDGQQLALDIAADKETELDRQWESAAEKEKRSHTKYAQAGIKPDEVAVEVQAIRAATGETRDVARFTQAALAALGATITDDGEDFTADTSGLPPALVQALPPAHPNPLPLHAEPPAPRKHALLARTDPTVKAIAAYVLEGALDPAALPTHISPYLAKRAGVFRTEAVTALTTVLLIRERFHLTIPARTGDSTHVVEHADVIAYTGPATDPQWLTPHAVAELIAVKAAAAGADGIATDTLQRALNDVPELASALDGFVEATAESLRESHRRVRTAANAALRGLKVTPVLPPDVLGVYVYLPQVRR